MASKMRWRVAFASPLCLTLLGVPQGGMARPADSLPAVSPARHGVATYTVTDVGTLGGANSKAFGINNKGQIVGVAETANGCQHAFVWQDGRMQDLGALGGRNSEARAINDKGHVVGKADTADGKPTAFLWQKDTMTRLTIRGARQSMAYGINDRDQVVGSHLDGRGWERAWLWQKGRVTGLGAQVKDGPSEAYAINAAGVVVGSAAPYRANGCLAVWREGRLSTDDHVLEGHGAGGTAINDHGDVVGECFTGRLVGPQDRMIYHAFLRTASSVVELAGIGGGSSNATAIDNHGHVIGTTDDGTGHDHAALWQNGKLVDLNSLLPSESGWVLERATSINDQGLIVGVGTHNGRRRAFLLRPLNEAGAGRRASHQVRGITSASLCDDHLRSSLAALSVPSASQRVRDDWPTLRHDARNTGLSTDTVAPPFRLAWRILFYHGSEPALLASGDIVCVTRHPMIVGETPEITLVHTSGRILWQIADTWPLYLKGNTLVVVQNRKEGSALEAYDLRTRQRKWSLSLDGRVEGVRGSIEEGGHLYCAYSVRAPSQGPTRWDFLRAALKVVNLRDGTEACKQVGGIQEWGVGPPASDGRVLYYGVSHRLQALDVGMLQPQWDFYDGGNAYVICTGDLVIAKGWQHSMQAWNVRTNKQAWSTGAPREMAHCLALGRGGLPLVVESSSGIDVASGSSVVRYVVGGYPVYSYSAAASGNLVYLAGARTYPSKRGGFYGFEAGTGKRRWRYERENLVGQAVIVSEGSVYALGSDGCLYKFVPASHRLR